MVTGALLRLVYAVLASWASLKAQAELLNVFILQRHGSRAPNPSVQALCPAVAGTVDDIRREFGADPGQLTPIGQNQMKKVGSFLYDHYFGGPDPRMKLPSGLTNEERAKYFHFQATTTQRHIDSVIAAAEQLFPSAAPSIVIDESPDNFLACPPAACVTANQEGVNKWMGSSGKSLYSNRKPCVAKAAKLCGHEFTHDDTDFAPDPHPPFQDVVDLFKSRAQAGLSLPQGADSVLVPGSQIQFDGIKERLFGTDEQVVYWMGDFPQRLLEAFAGARKRFGLYVTSREKLYAAEEYFGFVFGCDGLPSGAVYPATALIFELHASNGTKEVKVGYYYPGGHPTGAAPHAAALRWLTLPGCDAEQCHLDAFSEFIRRRSKVGGKDFLQICADKAGDARTLAGSSGHTALVSFLSLACFLGIAVSVVSRSRRAGYVRLVDA